MSLAERLTNFGCVYENCGTPGTSNPSVEFMDTAAFVSHLVPDDSVYAFLAAHRHRVFSEVLSSTWSATAMRRGCSAGLEQRLQSLHVVGG